jgi:hypothetical protein
MGFSSVQQVQSVEEKGAPRRSENINGLSVR